MKIGIASDHRGYERKEELKKLLSDYNIIDFGCDSVDMVDYPKYAFLLSEAVIKRKIDLGIIMCGTGIGVSIACNKVKGIRCAKIDSESQAKSAKEHNNANVLAFSAEANTALDIKKMIDIFINTKFSNNERYQNRINQVELYEDKNEY